MDTEKYQQINGQKCKCRPWWDVRCMCEPDYKNENWRACPFRYDTAVWLIMNSDMQHYDMIHKVNDGHIPKALAVQIVTNEYKLSKNGAKKVVSRCLAEFD